MLYIIKGNRGGGLYKVNPSEYNPSNDNIISDGWKNATCLCNIDN